MHIYNDKENETHSPISRIQSDTFDFTEEIVWSKCGNGDILNFGAVVWGGFDDFHYCD